jgi:hypothetical protein
MKKAVLEWCCRCSFSFGASPSARLRFGLVATAIGIGFLCAHAGEILEFLYGMRIEELREGIKLCV